MFLSGRLGARLRCFAAGVSGGGVGERADEPGGGRVEVVRVAFDQLTTFFWARRRRLFADDCEAPFAPRPDHYASAFIRVILPER